MTHRDRFWDLSSRKQAAGDAGPSSRLTDALRQAPEAIPMGHYYHPLVLGPIADVRGDSWCVLRDAGLEVISSSGDRGRMGNPALAAI